MKIAGFKMSVEEYPTQAEWIERLLRPLNAFAQSTVNSVNGNLTIGDNVTGSYKTVTVKIPAEPWTLITPQNGWSNYSGEPPLACHIEPNGRVTVRGTLNVGTKTDGTIIGSLPNSSYFPEYDTSFQAPSDSASDKAQVTVNKADGSFKIYDVGSTGNVFHFNGITFFAPNPPAPKSYVGADWPIRLATGFSTTVAAVFLVQATDVDTNETLSAGTSNIDWILSARNEVTVKRINGLTPNKSYKVTFLILGA